MGSVATTKQTYKPKAKSFLGSFVSNLGDWVCNRCIPVGGSAFGIGLIAKLSLVKFPIISIMPFIADITIIAGLALTILGIVTKVMEISKSFKKKE